MSQNDFNLQEAASKLRACRVLATKVATFGLDIEITEADAIALAEFEEGWQATEEKDQLELVALSGLSQEDVIGLVELIKHGESWQVGQQYGEYD